MKKALLLGTAFALVSFGAHAADLVVADAPAVSAPAASAYSGYVEVSGIKGSEFDDYQWAGFGIAGALAYSLDSNWQIEAEIGYQSLSDADGYYSRDNGLAALHANYYSDNFAVGVFGGVNTLRDYYDEGMGYGVFGGVEGQISVLDNLVLGGQIGYSKQVSGYYLDDYPLDFAFGQADLKFFPVDNLKLQASVGAAKGNNWDEDGLDLLSAGVEAEYQFEGTPLSIFASYTYTAENYYDYDYLDQSTVKVGARFSFDGESLKDQAKTGASHKVYDFSGVEAIRWW